jgi:hypothetical protein
MTDILVKYRGFEALEIELDKSSLSDTYKELVRKNSQHPAISRDPCRYTVDYLKVLADQAKTLLGWDWISDTYDLATTTRLHKDIETYLAQGFENIPEEHDHLCHELHYALHAIQGGNTRGQWIQVEWFNDDQLAMPEDFKFTQSLKFGDVKLQNPYVGHDPAFLFMQQDFDNIVQTCRFHDIVRPGINIMIKPYKFELTNNYLDTLKIQAPVWFSCHGSDKIIRYTGWPCIGTVLNLQVLEQIAESAIFELEKVEVV